MGGEVFQLEAQGSTNAGGSWSSASASVYARPLNSVVLAVRTRLSVSSGQTQGWSFSLKHDDSFTQQYGGSVTLNSVTTAGTQTTSVQNGSPPDVDETEVRAGFKGYTQGVLIDTEQAVTLGPTTNFVTSLACYTVTMPYYPGTYQLKLQFTHDIGSPAVRTIVTQGGLSNVPCAKNFTFYLYVNPYVYPTPGGCPFYYSAGSGGSGGLSPETGVLEEGPNGAEGGAGPQGAGAPGTDFRRGDPNDDGSVNLSDAVFLLNALFRGAAQSDCKYAADGNDDNVVDISDPVFVLNFLFLGGTEPPHPGPTLCGPDRTDNMVLQLDCLSYQSCNQTDTDGDGLTDFYEGRIGTLPDCRDTDGDFFEDGQEVLPIGVVGDTPPDTFDIHGAVDLRQIVYGLGTNGANPLRRDIFVEIDFFQAADGHHHRPSDETLNIVVNAFERRNIALHFDTGEDPFDLGGGNAVMPEQLEITFPSQTVAQIRDQHFDNNSRGSVFHWALAAHSLVIECRFGMGTIGGDSFIWRSPSVPLPVPSPEPFPHERSAHTFMHELGHNLGLDHGGGDPVSPKPNYRSVMNSIWYRVFIDTDCDADYGLCNAGDDCRMNPFGPVPPNCQINMNTDEAIDFSDEVLPTLFEGNLNEQTGICGNVPIDWNQDGILQTSVAVDLDRSGFPTALFQGFNDWSNIQLIKNRPPFPEDCGQGGGAGELGPPVYVDCVVE